MVWLVLVSLFRSRVSLEAEILILRHQLGVQRAPPVQETDLLCHGSANLCWTVSFDCEAGHRDPLPPCRFQIVLAPEIATLMRPRS